MSLTAQTPKNAVTFQRYPKAGSGWNYDQSDIDYDIVSDVHGRAVLYDSVGTAPVMSGQAKSSAVSLSTLAKNTV